ncbi:GNAT family N-acetyltransferase [Amycolatopsis antarctica]|uniref:GNAT family N-acetyltransferase n=1 Tax=Amycolatopsis antarctica TaxID=1854586 RepID=A0A263DA35_9PSEU|nr:GNAT family N-acetyltransferase [Amycolatopsis antarctica]OZM75039.1 GNAT family N-acetyltransferase [Amycolatopsis antarctica]
MSARRGDGHEVLDPRFDPEPVYWTALRKRAGLRADWSWDVLAVQAWCARTPQYVTVLHEGGEQTGVVACAWVGTPTRRHRFAGSARGGRIGGLDVRSPNSSAVPGWWFAGAGPDGGCRELLDRYLPLMRSRLGPGLRVLLARQLGEAGVSEVDGRFRLVRRTEDVGRIDLDGFSSEDDWTSTLRKKRRQSLHKIAATIAADPAVEVRVGALAGADPVEAAALMRYNSDKHRDVPIVPLPQFGGYLERLFGQPDVLGVRYLDGSTGRLLALGLIFDHPQWPVLRSWSALPGHLGGRRDLYFDVYREFVSWGIRSGKDGLILGKKMAELKRTLGAQLVPQYAAAIPVR